MREKYQERFKVVLRAIQGKNLLTAYRMINDEMTERVKRIKKREKKRGKSLKIRL